MLNQWTDDDSDQWQSIDNAQWISPIIALAIFITKKATYYFGAATNSFWFVAKKVLYYFTT